ncbi:MAG: glutaminyl-peptide cyclotransferase [Hungatella sp.]
MKRLLSLPIMFLLFIAACSGGRASVVATSSSEASPEVNKEPAEKREEIKIDLKSEKNFRQGDPVVINCTIDGASDSIKLFIHGEEVKAKLINGSWTIPTDKTTKVGTTNYKVTVYKENDIISRVGSYLMLPDQKVTQYKARTLKIYPHNKNSYTQGLEFHNGMLYESSGEYGKSYVHILEFPSMKSKTTMNLNAKLFAEGLTFFGDKMYLLTWQEHKCLVLDPKTLKQTGEFQYNTEGWGITHDEKYLYMSDGTQYIYILDPATFKQIDRLEVMLNDKPVMELNELEWIDGEIWANVFTTDTIVRINPQTGAVTGIVDASGLLLESDYDKNTNVLNGIAYDTAQKKIYLTGKNWPKLFEVVVRNE